MINPAIEIHLRLRCERRDDLLAFLDEAVPFYEQPGGIRVRLIEDDNDPTRLVEIIEYATETDYARDQHRVEHDTEMKRYLERWRALLAEPPVVEVYHPVPLEGGG